MHSCPLILLNLVNGDVWCKKTSAMLFESQSSQVRPVPVGNGAWGKRQVRIGIELQGGLWWGVALSGLLHSLPESSFLCGFSVMYFHNAGRHSDIMAPTSSLWPLSTFYHLLFFGCKQSKRNQLWLTYPRKKHSGRIQGMCSVGYFRSRLWEKDLDARVSFCFLSELPLRRPKYRSGEVSQGKVRQPLWVWQEADIHSGWSGPNHFENL